ncbi:MAG: protein kinase [Chitinophagales bacterium]
MQATEFKQRYHFDPHHDLIAEGTYSRVFRAFDQLLQRQICVKLYRKEFVSGSPLVRELSRAGVFFHPNICAFYDLLEIEETNVLGETEPQPIGILEYINGGTITQYLHGKSDDVLRRKLIRDCVNGLVYLHSLHRPHFDLKPENILVKEENGVATAKITDFLNSENLHTRTAPNSISTEALAYKAPEYFEGKSREATTKADIWALGLIVYEIFTGKKLFYREGDTSEKIIRNICYGDYYPSLHELPEPFKLFCEKCLIRDEANRNISLEELLIILQMPAPAAMPRPEKKPAQSSKPAFVETPQESSAPKADIPATPITPTPAPPAPATHRVKRNWLIPISLFALSGLAGGLWYLYQSENRNREPAAMAATVAAASALTEKPTPAATPAPATIIHDTVKLVQLVETPAPVPAKMSNAVAVETPASGKQPVLPAIDNMWVGKPYYVDLKTPLLSKEEFQLVSEEAAITELGQNTFYIKPMQAGDVFVSVINKKDAKKVAAKKYRVRDQKMPVATIGDDIFGGFVSPKLLLAKLTLQAKGEGGNYRIKSFHLSCKSGSCDVNDASSDNGRFNESMIQTLRNVKPGEKLYFDNIIAEDDQGQLLRLNDIQVTTY